MAWEFSFHDAGETLGEMEEFLERSGIRLLNDEYVVDYGHYQKDAESPHVIVSSGVGTWGMPMRVGTDCEIVSVMLHHGSPDVN